jgi:hypothetical protein
VFCGLKNQHFFLPSMFSFGKLIAYIFIVCIFLALLLALSAGFICCIKGLFLTRGFSARIEFGVNGQREKVLYFCGVRYPAPERGNNIFDLR